MLAHDPASSLLETGDLVLNRVTKSVAVGGADVRLEAKEYPLLEFLSLHKDRVHTREELVVELEVVVGVVVSGTQDREDFRTQQFEEHPGVEALKLVVRFDTGGFASTSYPQ